MKTLVIILIVLTGILILVGILVVVIYYKVRKEGGIYFRAAGYMDNPHPLGIDNLIFVTGNSMRAIEDKNRDFMLRIDDLRKQLDAWKEEIEKEEGVSIYTKKPVTCGCICGHSPLPYKCHLWHLKPVRPKV